MTDRHELELPNGGCLVSDLNLITASRLYDFRYSSDRNFDNVNASRMSGEPTFIEIINGFRVDLHMHNVGAAVLNGQLVRIALRYRYRSEFYGVLHCVTCCGVRRH
ncbi:unnamed protein product [Cylicostephanus goldi]|uniref:Uncharacterized protein n=1 Tax=Cylicostephanus goldi TaxID=71465 RepID=A0A3P7NKE9_CYLGO|nr:unnamed protein product [Cylicostephanus goldi]